MTKIQKTLRYALLLIIVVALLACLTLSLCACDDKDDDKDGGKDTDGENVSDDYTAILNFIDSSIGYSKENNLLALFFGSYRAQPDDYGIYGTYGAILKSKTDDYEHSISFIHFKDNESAVAYNKEHDAFEVMENSSVTVSGNFLRYEVDRMYDKIKQCSLPEGISDSPEYNFFKKSLPWINSNKQHNSTFATIRFGFDNDNKFITWYDFSYFLKNSNLSERRECASKGMFQYIGGDSIDAEWNYYQTSVSELNEMKGTRYTDDSYCYIENDVHYAYTKDLPRVDYTERRYNDNDIYYSAGAIYDYYDNVTTFIVPSTYKGKPVRRIQFGDVSRVLNAIVTLELSTNIRYIDYIYNCSNLKTVKYSGTMEQWHEIIKTESDFADITVICKDGTIKAGAYDENVSAEYTSILNFIDSAIGYCKENNAIVRCVADISPTHDEDGILDEYCVEFISNPYNYNPIFYVLHFTDNQSAVAYKNKYFDVLENSTITVSGNTLRYEVDGIYDKIMQCSLPEGVADTPEYKFLKQSLSMTNSKEQYDVRSVNLGFGFDSNDQLMTLQNFRYSIIDSNLRYERVCLSKAVFSVLDKNYVDFSWDHYQTFVSEFNEVKGTECTDDSYCYIENDVFYLSEKQLPCIEYEEHTDENNEIYYAIGYIYDYYDNITTFTVPSTYKSKPVEVISFNSGDIFGGIITLELPTSIHLIYSISGCTNLKTVKYDGTVAQWHEIEKRESDFANITVICKDGRIEAESNN